MIRAILIFFLPALFSYTFAGSPDKEENLRKLKRYEDTLKQVAPLIISSNNDSVKYVTNKKVTNLIESVLKIDESFDYPFDSLKTIAHYHSPDKFFRFYNWILPKTDGTYEYFGYLQYKDKKKKKFVTVPLKDFSASLEKPEKVILSPDKWYGSLYYKIVVNKKWFGKKYYTLLGWKGFNARSNKKVIDVLTFTNGKPKFGSSIFKIKKETKSRVVFQYTRDAVMSLRYDESDKVIIYDHLSPSRDDLKGQYEYYGPDLSYDALKFEKGKWQLIENYDARNSRSDKPKYTQPKKKERKLYQPQ